MKWIIALLLFLSPIPGTATITPINSLTELTFELEGDQVLAVFDIDDTLTILCDPAYHRPNYKTHHSEIFAQIMSPLTPKEADLAFTMPLLTSPCELIEMQTPELFTLIHSIGVKTIALTAAMGGKIGEAFMEDRRISELNRVGIDFSSSFPDVQETTFTNFHPPLLGSYPLFKNGVILANENDKGKVLVEFLKITAWTPTLVLFIDDRIDHVRAVEKALAQFNPEIQFKGFHFQGVPSYQTIDAENFSQKWQEQVNLAREILA